MLAFVKTTVSALWDALIAGAERFLLHPLTGGLTAIVTVMAGASAQFFQADIEKHFVPWPWASWDTVSWKATAFWLSVGVVGFLLGGGQWAQTRQARRSREALDAAIHRIESLPPEDFLADHQDLLRQAGDSALVVLGTENPKRELVDQAIRNVLGAIITLARKYDGGIGGRYAANIMVYRGDGKIQEAANPLGFVGDVEKHPDSTECWNSFVRSPLTRTKGKTRVMGPTILSPSSSFRYRGT